jgi:polar amino acid transport system substrate-binding protein
MFFRRLFSLSLLVGMGLAQSSTPLRVTVRVLEPFVIERGSSYTGFSAELWQMIAQRNNWRFVYDRSTNVTEMLSKVSQNQADVAITAISMTEERERQLDFSLPMFNSGLQIMVPAERSFSLQNAFEDIFSPQLGFIAFLMLLTIVLAGHFIWLLERRNPDYPKGYLAGVWEGIWWAAINLASNSIGERSPRGVVGRLLAMSWLFLGIVLLANFTAAVTANLTLREIRGDINGLDDLPGKRVLAVVGTTSSQFLTAQKINHQTIASVQEGYDRLEQGQGDALVYDSPVLQYYANTAGKGQLRVVGSLFKQEYYGIAVATNSPLREPINRTLIELISDGTTQELHERYFGE